MKVTKQAYKCLSQSGSYAEAKTQFSLSFPAVTAREKKYSSGRQTSVEIREVISDGVYTKQAVSCAMGLNLPSSFEELQLYAQRLQEIVVFTQKALDKTFLLKKEAKSLKKDP